MTQKCALTEVFNVRCGWTKWRSTWWKWPVVPAAIRWRSRHNQPCRLVEDSVFRGRVVLLFDRLFVFCFASEMCAFCWSASHKSRLMLMPMLRCEWLLLVNVSRLTVYFPPLLTDPLKNHWFLCVFQLVMKLFKLFRFVFHLVTFKLCILVMAQATSVLMFWLFSWFQNKMDTMKLKTHFYLN